jgi:pimeloyl-ACP methyl ester carboxylesterase
MKHVILIAFLVFLVRSAPYAKDDAAPAKYTVQFVTVDQGVKLEVVDWGGSGRPLVLLAALGADAHIYTDFAPKLTGKYHVYGITRRGFGASSVPATGYSADRLGDDVLAVIDSLKLNRPVLVGHSMAGEELSSVGSRHPEKVATLIYLDAAESYAFYDPASGDLQLDSIELRKKIDHLIAHDSDPHRLIADVLQAIPQYEKDLRDMQSLLQSMEPKADPKQPASEEPKAEAKQPVPEEPKAEAQQAAPEAPRPGRAILAGEQKYTSLKTPVLAIFPIPHAEIADMFEHDPVGRAAAEAADVARVEARIKVVEKAAPSPHIVRIAHASHMVFMSNEADVLREIDAFLGSLPGTP